MPKFLDTTGRSTYGIGLCDRCNRKFPLEELFSDPNSPGLKVCSDDLDEYDPYRLPSRKTEDVTLRFTRPDIPVTDILQTGWNPEYSLIGARYTGGPVTTGPRITEDGSIRVMEDPYRQNVDIG
jgi:hypothetical protein